METSLDKKDLADLFAFLALDKPPTDAAAKLIPGAPSIADTNQPPKSASRIKMESSASKLVVRSQLPGQSDWIELATYVMETNSRPYLHPVRDASGRVVLTEDRPADHPWQHGIFTGFHRVNGFNYWKEDEGKQRFVRLLDSKEDSDRVSWRALVELVAPNGNVVLEEEDTITIHAPESSNIYVIDFELLLRAKEQDVNFGKFFVGGLVRAYAVGQSQSAPNTSQLERTARPRVRADSAPRGATSSARSEAKPSASQYSIIPPIQTIPPAGAQTSKD